MPNVNLLSVTPFADFKIVIDLPLFFVFLKSYASASAAALCDNSASVGAVVCTVWPPAVFLSIVGLGVFIADVDVDVGVLNHSSSAQTDI